METLYHLDPPLTTTHHLLIDGLSKAYPTANGVHVVLEDIHLEVYRGEFVCLIGHSGCGKTTLLNMVAGFTKPTRGTIFFDGMPIQGPGPDRMMVFQNYALLPWLTAYQNIELAVKSVYPHKTRQRRRQIVEQYLELVGLTAAAHKRPSQLSGGMKQRVAIARALAIQPQMLILDEPFGALDAITKEELQDELLRIWRTHKLTVLMITHDIDEALYLSDRIVMMTNGPAARIGDILTLPFARPRRRSQLLEDPQYYDLRNQVVDFLYTRFGH